MLECTLRFMDDHLMQGPHLYLSEQLCRQIGSQDDEKQNGREDGWWEIGAGADFLLM